MIIFIGDKEETKAGVFYWNTMYNRSKAVCPVCQCVCLFVNQGGTNHNRWTYRLVILLGIQTFPQLFT